ncbi:protein kinase, partial [Sphaerospermopsis aphanizomenoides BCCUSP55]|uniref:protein kinase domain-containing protein n=1 Tax=Sphaerospermopsis aphanizomenoides TaxID=459663 RepID=UPI00190667EE
MAEPVRFQHLEVPLREDGSLFELGRGAMGITYKAFDTNLRCFVALKVINATYLGSEVARQRFLREARAAAALRHPNVATVFHLGEEEGNCFYAMEFVDGETVEAMMKKDGAIPVATALQIVIQVARALGAAQKQGLVHRDIKPSNLMLVREDDTDFTVKVIDFGLAKNAGGGGEDTATLTMGGFLGTPHFASPEQLEERDLDVRSDIYSLGVTLYYMLAGRAPFSGSLAQVMSQHLHRDPPLETLSGQKPEVISLLKHMLAKDPAGRPQTPADLRREAEACLESLGKSAVPTVEASPIAPECFETQVLDAPDSATAPSPAPGVTIAGRYRILREVRSSDLGRVFQAENLESGIPVALILAGPGLAGSAEALTRLEDRVMALQRLAAPSLQKIFSLERQDHVSFLTAEWIEAPCLLDLIKSRRALPLAEALEILRPLSSGFQALQDAGLSCPDIASHEVLLPGADLSLPVSSGVAVKFLPLSPEATSVSPETTMVTSAFAMMRDSGAFSAVDPKAYIFAVAALAYEILGGLKSAAGGAVPIPGLSEATNTSLRRALDPSASFGSLEDFLSALAAGTA